MKKSGIRCIWLLRVCTQNTKLLDSYSSSLVTQTLRFFFTDNTRIPILHHLSTNNRDFVFTAQLSWSVVFNKFFAFSHHFAAAESTSSAKLFDDIGFHTHSTHSICTKNQFHERLNRKRCLTAADVGVAPVWSYFDDAFWSLPSIECRGSSAVWSMIMKTSRHQKRSTVSLEGFGSDMCHHANNKEKKPKK